MNFAREIAGPIMERCSWDPNFFAREILGVRLWKRQRHVLRALWSHRHVSVKSANGIGKSFLGAVAAITYGSIFPDAVILTTATTFSQVRLILWREIARLVNRSRKALDILALNTELRWKNGSIAVGITAPEYDETKLQGYRGKNTLIIADEAGGLAPPIVEGIKSMLTGESVRLLMIGNPTDARSEFAKSFKTEGVEKFTIAAFDTPNFTAFGITQEDIASGEYVEKITGPLPAPHLVTPQWARERYEDWGPDDPRYIARVLAQFSEDGEDALVAMRHLEAAQERYRVAKKPENAVAETFAKVRAVIEERSELGVDVARGGADDSSIWHRLGRRSRRIKRIHGNDTMAVTGAVVIARRETKAKLIKVDVIGVGAGVVDRLKEIRKEEMKSWTAGDEWDVVGVNVGRASEVLDEKGLPIYLNLRAEHYWKLRKKFENGEIDIDPATSSDAVKQLNTMKWFATSKGLIQIEAKDDTKKNLEGKSPDDADALMLTFAEDPAFEQALADRARTKVLSRW